MPYLLPNNILTAYCILAHIVHIVTLLHIAMLVYTRWDISTLLHCYTGCLFPLCCIAALGAYSHSAALLHWVLIATLLHCCTGCLLPLCCIATLLPPCMRQASGYYHAWGTLLYITMHGALCCILPCMGHTAVYYHAWGTLLYTTMHGAHCCILRCMGHTAVYYHAWGTLLYITMHGAHCCILPCMGHTAVYCHTWGTLLDIANCHAWGTTLHCCHVAAYCHYTQPLPIACCHATPDSTCSSLLEHIACSYSLSSLPPAGLR